MPCRPRTSGAARMAMPLRAGFLLILPSLLLVGLLEVQATPRHPAWRQLKTGEVAPPPPVVHYACINLGTQCAVDPKGPYTDPKCGGKVCTILSAIPATPCSKRAEN